MDKDDNDNRMVCKYGSKCYQKNPLHEQRYKHPPKKGPKKANDSPPAKKFKMYTATVTSTSDEENACTSIVSSTTTDQQPISSILQVSHDDDTADTSSSGDTEIVKRILPAVINHKEFIKEKFLVDMPEDFYEFWKFCKNINSNNPQDALSNVGLKLVGPYDVLADKFCNTEEKSDEDYLIHWRYYYDLPEFQTVLKSDDKNLFHIGYFRDEPKMPPVFMAGNYAKLDGTITVMGGNIFASVYIYLEDLKKTGDPFKKIHIGKLQSALKEKASQLILDLAQKTSKITSRDHKVVVRTFNKAGLVVPYNRRTLVGYRELPMKNKELKEVLNKFKNAHDAQMSKLYGELQPALTYTNIATDECDFGTGIELGWNILFTGIDSLNQTTSQLLETSYNLLNRDEFAKIIKSHMRKGKRRTGNVLSII